MSIEKYYINAVLNNKTSSSGMTVANLLFYTFEVIH